MERAGLRDFFSFGAFSDMGATRGDLARIAVELAGVSGCAVTMTGDAPSDVAAAKSNGFRSVAVATGLTPRETLAALQPDLLLNDLSRPEDRHALIGD
jgi:phosphoglycolate phosphatase-like HAD superfamily hydrolase